MMVDPIRLKALDLLVEADQGKSLDHLLNPALNQIDDIRDRGFLAELVRGSIQWRERYRHVLRSFVTRDIPDDPHLRQLLYLSLHQMLGMNSVPPYAVIHQAGQLCRKRISERKVAFVNGVLQSVRRQILPAASEDATQGPGLAAIEKKLRPLFQDIESDPVRWIASWHSHPGWLVKRWLDQFGADQAEAICAANNRSVELYLRVLEPVTVEQALAGLTELEVPVLSTPGSRTLAVTQKLGQQALREMLVRLPYLIVQDSTVQMATTWLMAGREVLEKDGRWSAVHAPVLDMCAAPGGKTARLAAAWGDDHRIVAMDNRDHRLALLQDTLDRIGISTVEVLAGDGLNPPLPDGTFQAVLLDGPCSGTGVLRHHPEGRWNLARRSIGRNGKLLLELADKAADLLVQGGLLMYATCSLEAQENEAVLDALLARRDDLEPVPDQQGKWQRRWLPGNNGGDGFFAARLVRKG